MADPLTRGNQSIEMDCMALASLQVYTHTRPLVRIVLRFLSENHRSEKLSTSRFFFTNLTPWDQRSWAHFSDGRYLSVGSTWRSSCHLFQWNYDSMVV